jgi:hypothetical protein
MEVRAREPEGNIREFLKDHWITKESRYFLSQSAACAEWKCGCCGKGSVPDRAAKGPFDCYRNETPAIFQVGDSKKPPLCEDCLQLALKAMGRDPGKLDQ